MTIATQFNAPKVKSFTPPEITLMGPGPSDVPDEILEAMARPTIGHLDPRFVGFMDETKALLQYAFQTQNEVTLPMSGTGTFGMETCFSNLIERGDEAVIAVNGVFGKRMIENVERMGAKAIPVEHEWGTPVDPNRVEDALKANPNAKILAFVHAETSTGVRSDADTLCKLATQNDCLSIVDTVTSLGGIEVRVDDWGADAVYSGTQKCLGVPPSLSPVTFSDKAMEVVRNRETPNQNWSQDLNLIMGYWGEGGQRSYHHTAPINALYALHEGLRLLANEGLQNAWDRHQAMHQQLRLGAEKLGLEFLVEAAYRLPQLNAICIPEGVDEAALRKNLLEQYDLEIGAGLGPLQGKIWRVGLMGASAVQQNVALFLNGMEQSLRAQSYNPSRTATAEPPDELNR